MWARTPRLQEGLHTDPRADAAMQTDTKVPWIAVVQLPPAARAPDRSYAGDPRDVLLQGFHWDSHAGSGPGPGWRSWYRILAENAPAIRSAGFTWVWFPPPSDSLAPQASLQAGSPG